MRLIKPDLKEQHNKYINYNMVALPVGLPFNAYRVRQLLAKYITVGTS